MILPNILVKKEKQKHNLNICMLRYIIESDVKWRYAYV